MTIDPEAAAEVDAASTVGKMDLPLPVGAPVALGLSFAASRIYDAITESDGMAGLDRPILREAMRLRTPFLDGVATGYTDIAGKDIIARARPRHIDAVPPYEFSPSFSGGHALNAIVGASLLALTVGLGRVFLGHHWFTDVPAGWTLGGTWLALIITAHRLYLTVRKSQYSLVRGKDAHGQVEQ